MDERQLQRYNLPLFLILVGLGALLFLSRLYSHDEPLERDVTVYAVIGHELLQGRALYSDLWDHKPPAIHVTYAAAELLVGYGQSAILFLSVLAGVVSLLGVYAAAKRLGSKPWTGILGAVFWVLISGDFWLQANQPNTEVFLNACLVWVFWLVLGEDDSQRIGKRAVSIGILIAVASLYKNVALVALLAYPAGLLLLRMDRSRTPGAAAHLGLWFAIVLGAWVIAGLYFLLVGAGPSFFDAVITYNQAYAGSLLRNLALGVHPDLLLPGEFLVLYPLAAASLLALLLNLKSKPYAAVTFFCFMVGTWTAVAAPGKFYPHYYQLWLPAFCIGAAWSVATISRFRGPYGRWGPWGLSGVLIIWLAGWELPQYRISAEEWSRIKLSTLYPARSGNGDVFVESKELGLRLREMLEGDETFFEWGSESGLYFYSQKSPPSGVFFHYPLVQGPLKEELLRRVVNDLERVRPRFFIVRMEYLAMLEEIRPLLSFLRDQYSDTPVDSPFPSFLIFERLS